MMTRRTLLLVGGSCLLTGLPMVGTANNANAAERSFIEAYAFTCPHCYQLARQLRVWLPLHPQVRHYPVHVINTADDLKLAAAGYAAALLGKGEDYRLALFQAIHADQQAADEHTLVAAAESLRLDARQFVHTMQSAETAELLARSERITRQFQIAATPTLIIGQQAQLPERDPLEILQEAFANP